MAVHDRRPPHARFRLRHRGDRPRPCPSASGGRRCASRRASSGTSPTCSRSPSSSGWRTGWWRDVRRHRVRVQFRRGSDRSLHQDGARFHWARGKPERHRIVTFEGAFHGRTMATISAAGSKKMIEGFAPLLPGLRHRSVRRPSTPCTPRSAPDRRHHDRADPGGRRHPPGAGQFLQGLRALCDEHGLLLVFDEVQARHGPDRHAASPTSRRASHPTSWGSPRGWAAASRSARASRPRRGVAA